MLLFCNKTLRSVPLLVTVFVVIWICIGQLFCQSQPPNVLKTSWEFYKHQFMENDERVKSETFGGTISEGQSYALLKAVWMDDPTVFEKTWQWTNTHLARPHDHLFAWRWGQDSNTATDADEDIAYALLLASEKWNRPDYRQAAISMIQDLWQIDVVSVHGRYYLVPGTWDEFKKSYLTLDPSYFAPYVYRKFAQYDSHNWQKLADDIYPTLEACSDLRMDKLPPNWCGVTWNTGKIIFSDKQGPQSRDFGYDAVRVFWRMALDSKYGSIQAKQYLATHPVLVQSPVEFTLAAAFAQSPQQFYLQKLQSAYNPQGYWFNDHNDYLQSVIWFSFYTRL